MGKTEKNVAVCLTATKTTPEAALIVATLTGGEQQDVVVEGSFETGIESLQYGDVFPTKEMYCSSFW